MSLFDYFDGGDDDNVDDNIDDNNDDHEGDEDNDGEDIAINFPFTHDDMEVFIFFQCTFVPSSQFRRSQSWQEPQEPCSGNIFTVKFWVKNPDIMQF